MLIGSFSTFLLSDVFSRKVAFHVVFTENTTITLKKGEHVICEHVVTNASGGYNPTTGVLTVPVSGIYCFLVSSTPDEDASIHCWANMLDDVETTYLAAFGQERCTAHAVVYARAGQKVFVKSTKDTNKFLGYWNTSFSGFLVCPDV
jgi:hypothetical protein